MMNMYDDPNPNFLFGSNINDFFPMRRKLIRRNTQPWIIRDILSLMRVRDEARRGAWKNKPSNDFNTFKRLRNRVTINLRKVKLVYFQRQLDGCKGVPKSF